MKWIIGILCLFAFAALMVFAGEADRERCEVTLANKLHTTAAWVNGKCWVKGYSSTR